MAAHVDVGALNPAPALAPRPYTPAVTCLLCESACVALLSYRAIATGGIIVIYLMELLGLKKSGRTAQTDPAHLAVLAGHANGVGQLLVVLPLPTESGGRGSLPSETRGKSIASSPTDALQSAAECIARWRT
eukprot:6183426-Pleurochrysis_carterae.AAC.1